MDRRTYLVAVVSAGGTATAGCSAVASNRTLSEPTVTTASRGRKALVFRSNGEEVGQIGADGTVESDRINLSTEIWHRDGTVVDSIELRMWMPESATDSPATIAVASPVEGDSSPPPSVALYTPDRDLGTVVEITDLDDLADETISTLDFVVVPGSETATELNIHATVKLAGDGVLDSDYTLDGELQLAYPELGGQ